MGPNDAWFAECLPCKWQETYSTQDSAIHAAEDHVFAHHRNIPAEIRGDKKMGHVQLRTIGAAPVIVSPAPAPAPSGTDATGSALSSASSAAPEHSTVIDISTADGKTIEVKE